MNDIQHEYKFTYNPNINIKIIKYYNVYSNKICNKYYIMNSVNMQLF